ARPWTGSPPPRLPPFEDAGRPPDRAGTADPAARRYRRSTQRSRPCAHSSPEFPRDTAARRRRRPPSRAPTGATPCPPGGPPPRAAGLRRTLLPVERISWQPAVEMGGFMNGIGSTKRSAPVRSIVAVLVTGALCLLAARSNAGGTQPELAHHAMVVSQDAEC